MTARSGLGSDLPPISQPAITGDSRLRFGAEIMRGPCTCANLSRLGSQFFLLDYGDRRERSEIHAFGRQYSHCMQCSGDRQFGRWGQRYRDRPRASGANLSSFYRIDQARTDVSEGVGLGLPIAKAIAELYGASINVTSTLGEGTTFLVEFPNLENTAQAVHDKFTWQVSSSVIHGLNWWRWLLWRRPFLRFAWGKTFGRAEAECTESIPWR